MNARMVLIILGVTVWAGLGLAQPSQAPEQVIAHPARLSDRAQIELLLDEWRSATENPARVQALQKRFQAAPALPAQKTGESRTAEFSNSANPSPEISIDGESAMVEFPNGERLTLKKHQQQWQFENGELPRQAARGQKATSHLPAASNTQLATNNSQPATRNSQLATPAFSAGQTFIPTPVSQEHGIQRLTRNVTQANLDRSLFGAPEKTASYYFARYSNSAPYVTATYIQLVTDPAWNRILYGSSGRWIKSYEDVQGPSAIAVDAEGRVFVGETGRNRVLALQLRPQEENTRLEYRFEIPGVAHPADLAVNDNGTPLDISDDFLYVADPVQNKVLKYALQSGGAALTAAFEGFDAPTAVLAGKWNGANTDFIYVIDQTGRRLQLLEDRGASLIPLKEIKGAPGQYFSALKADHFGNIYLVDNINSQLTKYTAGLELLDGEGGKETFDGLANLDIGFGKIIVEGEGTYWAGFDQLFALERWSGRSGAQRRTLGTAIRNAVFQTDEDFSEIRANFTLTDFAAVRVQILDERHQLAAELPAEWLASGAKTKIWNRRSQGGEQVPPGMYRYEISAKSPYRDETVTLTAQLYLPLYYWQDCGSDVKADDGFRVQGRPVKWGDDPSQTALEHPEAVIYRFGGLNPESEYQLALECFAGDGMARNQEIFVDGETSLGQIRAGGKPTQTGYLSLPKEAYADGQVTISIVNRNGGSAVVSQLWMKETGAGLNPQLVPENGSVPSGFVLEQNYPNPFNPNTHIGFRIPQGGAEGTSGFIELKIYDITGRVVRTLVSEPKMPGRYVVEWDGANEFGQRVASGVYFYQLAAGRQVQSKKMVLLR